MRMCERRPCPKCGARMRVVDGSDRTAKDRVFFHLRCPRCDHTEMDWCSREDWRRSMR